MTPAFCQANCSLRGVGEVVVTHAITTPAVSVNLTEEERPDFCSTVRVLAKHVSVVLCLYAFPELTDCNTLLCPQGWPSCCAEKCQEITLQHLMIKCTRHRALTKRNATPAELAICTQLRGKKEALQPAGIGCEKIYFLCVLHYSSDREKF